MTYAAPAVTTMQMMQPMDMFAHLDVNGDGQLSREEFAAFSGVA